MRADLAGKSTGNDARTFDSRFIGRVIEILRAIAKARHALSKFGK
jgi:hypothetical protein